MRVFLETERLILMRRAAWGQGYATEGASALMLFDGDDVEYALDRTAWEAREASLR